MISSLATPITLPQPTSPATLFDSFTSKEPTQTSLGKRPNTDVELDESNVRAMFFEDDEDEKEVLDCSLRVSRHEEEMRRT